MKRQAASAQVRSRCSLFPFLKETVFLSSNIRLWGGDRAAGVLCSNSRLSVVGRPNNKQAADCWWEFWHLCPDGIGTVEENISRFNQEGEICHQGDRRGQMCPLKGSVQPRSRRYIPFARACSGIYLSCLSGFAVSCPTLKKLATSSQI